MKDLLFLPRVTAILLLAFMLALVTACGGTKVYTIDKTVVHKDSLYNLDSVSKISTRIVGELKGGDVVNMKNLDEKAVEKLIDENDSVIVSTIFDLDDEELVYQRVRVETYREYSKVVNNFEKAGKKMTRFMADKKDTQLKL